MVSPTALLISPSSSLSTVSARNGRVTDAVLLPFEFGIPKILQLIYAVLVLREIYFRQQLGFDMIYGFLKGLYELVKILFV